jgi:hypothetical protein
MSSVEQHGCRDEEMPEETFQDRLSWRGEDSFSDYTIVITVIKKKPRDDDKKDVGGDDDAVSATSDEEEAIYNVRKCFLADGFLTMMETSSNRKTRPAS